MKPSMKLMRAWMVGVLLVVFGVADVAFAQVVIRSSGGALKKRAYQTYGAMTLYVDPTGSDSNACTASGASACATLGGALNKVPIHIRHAVTVNVAAGTYTEVFRVQGFKFAPANGAAPTAALNITGVQSAFTVATGTNTGTVSSYVAPTAGAHPLLNDGTQTWTVNDLRGRYVTITAGAGVGEYHLITSNTATQLSLAYPFTAAPTGASTYEIRSPGPVFTGAGGTVAALTGTGLVTISDITIQPASGAAFVIGGSVQNPITTTRTRFVGTTTGVFAPGSGTTTTNTGPSYWRMNQVLAQGGTLNGLQVGAGVTVSSTEVFIRCSGTCSGSGFTSGTNNTVTLNGTVAGDFTLGLVYVNGSTFGGSLGLWLDCGAGTNTGIYLAAPSTLFSGWGSWAAHSGPYLNGCLNGYSLNGLSQNYIDGTAVFTTVTNAVVLAGDARAIIEPGPTFTGVTNQLTIDGTVYTDADLTTFTRITGPQGSYASRP